ncbi:MAG: fluoride efflux transporter CrcB [Planctomycetaceae bacterium]|jgi:CrcB protein|nr:fluoride efflux transporter CrcB [Planctomycetaceae bacterium]MDA0809412.1 fluoride efflux transporter CrcB [Planctomycetota bacterium]MDA0920185.1 fluoride efflux transporter CrcB [Planctomycetota bacterium]
MPDWLAVGIGGFVGAVSRFQISLWLSVWSTQKFGRIYPFGTFAVNVVGCLFIGILMALAVDRKISDVWQKILVTGCLGSLTTFSTFSYETIGLIRSDRPGLAAVYVVANLAVGLVAVMVGMGIARAIVR